MNLWKRGAMCMIVREWDEEREGHPAHEEARGEEVQTAASPELRIVPNSARQLKPAARSQGDGVREVTSSRGGGSKSRRKAIDVCVIVCFCFFLFGGGVERCSLRTI